MPKISYISPKFMITSKTFNISIFQLPFWIPTDHFDKNARIIRASSMVFNYFCPIRVKYV